jgi:hypothetical protein
MTTRIRNRKNCHRWILDHKDEILALPNKERTDYVMGKLNDELGVEMKHYNVYQLLYRNGLIKHKNETEIVIETTETTTDTTQEEPDAISGGPVDEQYLHKKYMKCLVFIVLLRKKIHLVMVSEPMART